ncbi:RodZ family helix-turn-helix domain-containing protein [Thermotoga sp. SG1]|uniref:helix-turn-helix domain-containing protein n=1 Tax=Thermotoga sp. SG1 TaxID=126739 RepID=UPI000CC2038C|nr:helix-turn-helix domain-containing protein [Thermotoga sp. SG1]PLV57236.1 DNA-binding protein [Thermotoga sp. SG1]
MGEKWKEMGEIFRKKREEKGITLLDASLFTNINPSKLKRIEEGDLQNLDAEIYVKSYIKRYAEFLELSPEEMLKMYEEGKGDIAPEEKKEKRRKEGEKSRSHNLVLILFLVIGVVLLVFAIFENLRLQRTSPAYLITSDEVTLNGKTLKGTIPLSEGKYTVEAQGEVILRTASEEWKIKLKEFEVRVQWER